MRRTVLLLAMCGILGFEGCAIQKRTPETIVEPSPAAPSKPTLPPTSPAPSIEPSAQPAPLKFPPPSPSPSIESPNKPSSAILPPTKWQAAAEEPQKQKVNVVTFWAQQQFNEVSPGGKSTIAIHFELEENWHFYASADSAPGGMNLKLEPNEQGPHVLIFSKPIFPKADWLFD